MTNSFCRLLTLMSVTATLLLVGCAQEVKQQPNENDYLAIEDSVVTLCYSQPIAASEMVDRVVHELPLLDLQKGYLQAVVLCEVRQQPDSALAICEHLVDNQSWREYEDQDAAHLQQLKIFELMARLGGILNNPVVATENASKAIDLTHGRKSLRVDESLMLSLKGYVEDRAGQPLLAQRTLNDALELVKSCSTWSEQSAFLVVSANLATSYLKQREYVKVDSVVTRSLRVLDILDAGPDQQYDRLQPSVVTAADYRSLLHEHRRACYCYKFHLFAYSDPAESKRWLAKLDELDAGKESDYSIDIMVRPLSILNMYNRAHEMLDDRSRKIGKDTVTSEYAELLKLRGCVLMQQGKHREALNWMMRHSDLTDLLSSREYADHYEGISVRVDLDTERTQREKAEMKNRHLTRTLFIVVWTLLLVALCVLVYYFFYKHRQVRQLYANAKEELDDAQEQLLEANEAIEDLRAEATEADQVSASTVAGKSIHQRVFQRMEEIMNQDHPYLDPNFDIQKMADLVGTNRTYVSASVNVVKGINFPSWVSDYRIEHAKELFYQNPNAKIEEVCMNSGFDTVRTFYRQFQKHEGITPGQFVERLG